MDVIWFASGLLETIFNISPLIAPLNNIIKLPQFAPHDCLFHELYDYNIFFSLSDSSLCGPENHDFLEAQEASLAHVRYYIFLPTCLVILNLYQHSVLSEFQREYGEVMLPLDETPEVSPKTPLKFEEDDYNRLEACCSNNCVYNILSYEDVAASRKKYYYFTREQRWAFVATTVDALPTTQVSVALLPSMTSTNTVPN